MRKDILLDTLNTDSSAVNGRPSPEEWLVEAEEEYAKAEALSKASEEEYASKLAQAVNNRLDALGITPIEPARTDGRGRLFPAFLAPEDPERKLHSVHATYDEDRFEVCLLAGGLGLEEPEPTGYHLHHEMKRSTALYDIAVVRRSGPMPPRMRPERPSVDAQAIVAALGDLKEAVDTLTRAVGRP